ncbi:MAG: cysteine hydrolase [Chloroflexi bacterium]|nr:cysteine hydrolase [Chloroflexota bacterium]
MRETEIEVKRSALLVIDMQNHLIKSQEECYQALIRNVRSGRVIDNIARVVSAARQVGMRVVFTAGVAREDGRVPGIIDGRTDWPVVPNRYAKGTSAADIIEETRPLAGEPVVYKCRSDAFCNTNLEAMLRSYGIDTVIVTGVLSDACVAGTVIGARQRDLHVIVLSDCCATNLLSDQEYFMKSYYPIRARVRTSKEILAAMAQGRGR